MINEKFESCNNVSECGAPTPRAAGALGQQGDTNIPNVSYFTSPSLPLEPISTNPKDVIGRTKPPLELVPPSFLILTSMAMKLGAKKYGPYNWRHEKVSAMVYLGAALRHIQSAIDGEEIDHESGVSHIAHAAACMAIFLDAQATGNMIDDRPPKGRAAELIQQLTEKK